MLTSQNSPKARKKKAPAKKPWKDVQSKPSVTSGPRPKPVSPADVDETLRRLKKAYPDAHCELNFSTPFQLLVATVLSAQCTDARVNIVTRELFRVAPDASSLHQLSLSEIEKIIRSTGFYKNKAKSLKGLAEKILADHSGEVPTDMQQLRELPGVGRKTANVVLGNAYSIAVGVVVDTHVGRLARRWGWTRSESPEKIEQELMQLVKKKDWVMLSHWMIFHGRRVCKARNPSCEACFLVDLCPKKGLR